MLTTLITGGLGFIGSHLADLLLSRGERVLVLDDLSAGTSDNLRHQFGNERLEVVVDTVLNEPVLHDLVARADRVFHLAAVVGVQLVVSDPIRVHEINAVGTSRVLKACAAHGRPVLLASTSEVYGKSTDVPFREDADLVLGPTSRPRWGYACSKAMSELLGLAYFRTLDLPVTVVRFFNTAGPRQTGRYGMVIPRFVRQALAGEPITVYGDGTQSRCFCHVHDAVRAAAALMATAEARGQVVNVGTTERVTIRSLAEHVKALAGSESVVTYVPFEEAYATGLDDMDLREPDLTRVRALTGFSPTRTLADIINDVIAHHRG